MESYVIILSLGILISLLFKGRGYHDEIAQISRELGEYNKIKREEVIHLYKYKPIKDKKQIEQNNLTVNDLLALKFTPESFDKFNKPEHPDYEDYKDRKDEMWHDKGWNNAIDVIGIIMEK